MINWFIEKVAAAVIRQMSAATESIMAEEKAAATQEHPAKEHARQYRRKIAGRCISVGTADFTTEYERSAPPSGVRWTEPPAEK
jgi:hypothetical protein